MLALRSIRKQYYGILKLKPDSIMRNRIWLLFIILIQGCDVTNDVEEIEQISKNLSQKHNCRIVVLDKLNNNVTSAELTYHCARENPLFGGKLLMEFFDRTQEKKISFESYSISNETGDYKTVTTYQTLSEIKSRKFLFDSYVEKLKFKKVDSFWTLLSPELKKNIDEQSAKSNLKNLLVDTYPDFDGFGLVDNGNNKYVIYRVSNKTKYIMITLSLEGTDTRIYGFEVI